MRVFFFICFFVDSPNKMCETKADTSLPANQTKNSSTKDEPARILVFSFSIFRVKSKREKSGNGKAIIEIQPPAAGAVDKGPPAKARVNICYKFVKRQPDNAGHCFLAFSHDGSCTLRSREPTTDRDPKHG